MDKKEYDINEYCDKLSDLKDLLDQDLENTNIELVILKVNHPEASTEKFQKRLKKIMKYINSHDCNVEVEYK